MLENDLLHKFCLLPVYPLIQLTYISFVTKGRQIMYDSRKTNHIRIRDAILDIYQEWGPQMTTMRRLYLNLSDDV